MTQIKSPKDKKHFLKAKAYLIDRNKKYYIFMYIIFLNKNIIKNKSYYQILL